MTFYSSDFDPVCVVHAINEKCSLEPLAETGRINSAGWWLVACVHKKNGTGIGRRQPSAHEVILYRTGTSLLVASGTMKGELYFSPGLYPIANKALLSENNSKKIFSRVY